ncbi:Cohesin subunit SCC3 [Candida viswanathii]|uniref:Cohesin subunit SCC3 n=1 Tax=Candida viswanathii TaxID=5486 RepID=A0A367YF03_9ASCO|nr:Cohesin subunit SCC3 [Candida viswanathii]
MVRRLSRRANAAVVSYKDGSDSEDDVQVLEEEEEFEVRKPVKRKASRKSKLPAKRQKKSKKTTKQLEEGLEENYLYQALANTEASIQDVALDWVEEFEEDLAEEKHEAITGLINLILRSCGSLHLFQPHDLSNLESSADTVGEIAIAFGEQSFHKYPFKALPVFKKNVLQLFQEIIEIAHEKGLLYVYDNDSDEESLASPLMSYLLTWTTSLSTSPIRSLRFTVTEIIFTVQSQLCKVIKSIEVNLDRSQRQLTKVKKSNKSKYETLTNTIESCQLQKNTVVEYFNDIVTIVVDKRYRDVDPQIRSTTLKHLGDAMVAYPEFFCQGIYLRYFGWLLCDPIGQVRAENTRCLIKLYRSFSVNNLPLGLRQFSEKYKLQLIKMSQIDSDTQVRMHSLSICCELLKLGFLDDEDTKVVIENYPFKDNARVQAEGAKFVTLLNEESASRVDDKYKLFLETYKPDQFQDNISACLSIKSLIQLLVPIADKPVEVIFQNLGVHHETNWELSLKYFLLDVSLMRFTKEDEDEPSDNEEIDEFKQQIDLSDVERLVLLKFIHGYIKYLYSKKVDDEVSAQLVKLVEYLPSILNVAVKSSKLFTVFLQIWTILLVEKESGYSLFDRLNKLEEYEEITSEIIKYFKEFDITAEFAPFFAALFESHGLTSAIKFQVQTVLDELVQEVIRTVNDRDDAAFDLDSTNDELNDQISLIESINNIAPVLHKLRELGDFVNIANLSDVSGLITTLVNKVLRKFDLALIRSQWKHNFLQQLPTFLESLTRIYDLVLVIVSWKFERLMETTKEDQNRIAIDLEFDGIVDLINQTMRLVYECSTFPEFVDLKTTLIMKYIDFLLSFKVFYVKFEGDNDIENFLLFFNSNKQLLIVKRDMQLQILQVFLVKEVKLAHVLQVELDRDDEEDVNFDDYIEQASDRSSPESSMFEEQDLQASQASNNDSDAKKEQTWRFEKDLSVYTLKLLSLVNLLLVQEDVYSRVSMNKDKLGSVFGKILERQEVQEKNIKEREKQSSTEEGGDNDEPMNDEQNGVPQEESAAQGEESQTIVDQETSTIVST